MGQHFRRSGDAADVAKTAGTSIEVKKEEATEVAKANRSRLSLTLCNDSSEGTIYVFKGEGAAIGKGIRLNKEGGSTVIEDYTGIVTAAAKTAASKLCVTEV